MAKKSGGRTWPIERLSGIESAQDRREIMEVFGRAFSGPTWMEDHMRRCVWSPLVADPEHTRIAVAGGRAVSGVVMAPRTIRFGPVAVPAMTIGPVGTHDRFRKRGYGAAAMNEASRYMAEHGVLVAYLQGIPNFYCRFGYYPYLAPGAATFKRDAAKKESLPGRLRAMKRDDIPRVRRLYDRASAGRLCAAVRDKTVWDWLIGPARTSWMFPNPRVILDDRGRLCGYLTMERKGDLRVEEIVIRPGERSCRVALGAMVREARRRETKEIKIVLPWDDALAVFLRQFVGGDFVTSANPTGGRVMKVVDFPALMRRLGPLFTQRWKEAGTRLRGATFNLSSEVGSVGLTVGPHSVRVGARAKGPTLRVPQRWLSGLLTGYYTVRDIAPAEGGAAPAKLVPVLDILFPPGHPFVYRGDNY